jgi:hypothetical protein
MIRVQPTSSGEDQLLVGSDLEDPAAARAEVEEWVSRNNYSIPRNTRQLSVFENGVLVREWVLVEAKQETAQRLPSGPFARFWRRPAEAKSPATSGKLILLDLDEAA